MSRVTRKYESRLREEPYIRAPSEHEFGFFTQPFKLLSLNIKFNLPSLYLYRAFKDQSVFSDNDPPYTVLIRVLVSSYKREVFVIKLRGYLLQVLPVRVPDCNTSVLFL